MTLTRVIALPASPPLPYPSQRLAQAHPEFQLVTSDLSGKFNEIPGEGEEGIGQYPVRKARELILPAASSYKNWDNLGQPLRRPFFLIYCLPKIQSIGLDLHITRRPVKNNNRNATALWRNEFAMVKSMCNICVMELRHPFKSPFSVPYAKQFSSYQN